MTDAKTIDVSTEAVAKEALEWRAISDDDSDIFSSVADVLSTLAADRDRLAGELAAVLKRAEEAERQASALAADQCHSGYGDERGNHRCKYQDDLVAAQATVAKLQAENEWRPFRMTRAERQSGLDRVRWAEGLIEQLPESHDGATSWLLNYGTKDRAKQLRSSRGIGFDDLTASAPTVPTPQSEPTK